MARLVYLGTPEVGVPPLRALAAAGHEIVLVVSQPDRRRGRGAELVPAPVKRAATELGLPVSDRVDDVLGLGAELGVVVAFGRLIRPHVLAEVPMVNLHFSLLPRWRGAAPVERALLAGDEVTGVCLMELEEGLDTGPVYECAELPITDDDTLESLRSRLVDVGTEMLVRRLASGRVSLGTPRAQEGEPTYAAKLAPAELRIDWSRPARELARLVRLGSAWTSVGGRRLRVLAAAAEPGGAGPGVADGTAVGTGDGVLRLVRVQPEGKGAMAAEDWARGARLAPGAVLGE
ncbi:MAG TPA: methionyl-tRNA formyltransferase [Acidimicrobiales bacterium]|nr:methionyl-tRNA formyltransferase [Acidimicrobiales bacterium]